MIVENDCLILQIIQMSIGATREEVPMSVMIHKRYCQRTWWIIRPTLANVFRAGFPFIRPSREAVSSSRSPPPSALSFTEPFLPFREPLLASGALNRLSRRPAAEENRGLPPLSIVGWFCRLPWLESAGGSVAPDVCLLALAAGRRPLVGMGAPMGHGG